MLKSIIKYRPTNLYAVYVEPLRIEVLQAHRHWRSWEIGVAEQSHVPQGESVFDHLQYLNLKPKGRKGSALLAIVSSVFYSVHSEHYPLSIKDQLDDAINFDWQENIFLEHDRTLHFSGPPVALNQHVSVPIFSIQREIYDKLNQALNGALFHTFAVVPSALSFSALLPLIEDDGGETARYWPEAWTMRILKYTASTGGPFWIQRWSVSLPSDLKLFAENLKCLGDEECEPHIHLVCAPEECNSPEDPAAIWAQGGVAGKGAGDLRVFRHQLASPPAQTGRHSHFRLRNPVKAMANSAHCRASGGAHFHFRPLWPLSVRTRPKAWFRPASASKFRSISSKPGGNPSRRLQTRITKFQEDQKTLSEFNREDYQLLELLSFLTQLTPEDTWLNYLSLRQGQLILRGESKSAIKYLAGTVENRGAYRRQIRFSGNPGPGTDQERFNVQLQLDMEKLKKSFEALPPETPGEVLSERSECRRSRKRTA